jgi:hypothetical protein
MFGRGSSLNVHMRVHTGVKPYKCDICNKYFSEKSNLKTHVKKHRDVGEDGGSKTTEIVSVKVTMDHPVVENCEFSIMTDEVNSFINTSCNRVAVVVTDTLYFLQNFRAISSEINTSNLMIFMDLCNRQSVSNFKGNEESGKGI